MTDKLSIGIVDYGVGNHASVRQCIHQLGMRCRVDSDPSVLDACDLLLLPGVGAFPLAMQSLLRGKLAQFLTDMAHQQKPILGICLGMQLLTSASHEGSYTIGLGLIPGEIVPLAPHRWHIGWNTVEPITEDPLFRHESDEAFYFNHSYTYKGPEEFQACKTYFGAASFASVIRRHKIAGLQFHPEKSQEAGHKLLLQIIKGLCNA